jgi:predicted  nucleic acid-binding Zn-ribbon protein
MTTTQEKREKLLKEVKGMQQQVKTLEKLLHQLAEETENAEKKQTPKTQRHKAPKKSQKPTANRKTLKPKS